MITTQINHINDNNKILTDISKTQYRITNTTHPSLETPNLN